jgi:hypothetical protein
LNGLNGVQLDKIIWIEDDHANRIAHDDENLDGTVQPAEDESWLDPADTRFPRSGLRIDIADDTPRFYRVMAFWCEDEETIPSPSNPDTFDHGGLAEAVQFPCTFGGGPSSMIYADMSDYDNSLTAQGYPEIAEVSLIRAWLILLDPQTGERARSASPVPVDADGVAFFDAEHIARLTNNFGSGHYFVYVEMEDENGCFGLSDPNEVDLGLGACCLDATGTRPHERTGTLEVKHDVAEICGTLRMQVGLIELDVRKNGGKTRRYQEVYWSVDGGTPELIWSGDAVRPVIDRTADPLVLEPGSTARMHFLFNIDPVNSDLTVVYSYRIAGAPGTCTFVTPGL